MPGRSAICSICGVEVQHLMIHMKNVHLEKYVPCEVCDKTFKSVSLKINHVNNVHGLMTSCLICELTYSSNAYLRAHIRKVHNKQKLFKCEYCDKQFTTKQMLKLHDFKFGTVNLILHSNVNNVTKFSKGNLPLVAM